MTKILTRFDLDAVKFNDQVLWCLVGIWVAVLACTISSIWNRSFSRRQRWFWIAIVVGVPILGLLVYLPISFRPEDYPHLLAWRKSSKY